MRLRGVWVAVCFCDTGGVRVGELDTCDAEWWLCGMDVALAESWRPPDEGVLDVHEEEVRDAADCCDIEPVLPVLPLDTALAVTRNDVSGLCACLRQEAAQSATMTVPGIPL